MAKQIVLKVVEERTNIAELTWKNRIPPIMIGIITVFVEGTAIELSPINHISEVINDDSNNQSLKVTLKGYYKICDLQNVDTNVIDKLNKNSLPYAISYFYGESGQLYELESDYDQQNEPKITFEISEVDVNKLDEELF